MKPIVLVINNCWMSKATAETTLGFLTTRGFDVLAIFTRRYESPELQMFNVAGLPQADMDEIRAVIQKQVRAAS